ncbi:MATE family efflux transporter [Chitinophaga lutea]
MQVNLTNRQIIAIAAPISLSLVLPQINHMTNVAFLGHLGEFPLAANGIAGIYYLVMYMIAYGLNNGLQVLFARRAGEGNYAGMGRYFSNGVVLALCFSAFAITVTYLAAPAFFRKALHDPAIREAAGEFMRIRVWGLPFLMLMGLCNAFYIGTGRTRLLAVTSLFQEATNIILDYLLIFGKAGFPALGLYGAAYASVAAEIVGLTVALTMLFAFRFPKKFHLLDRLRPDRTAVGNILTISAPLIMQYLFSIGSWLVFFIFIEHLGQRQLAISNLMRSVFGLFGIFTWALAATCNTMVSNLIGQQREDDVLKLVPRIVRIAFICAVFVCLLINLFPYQLLHIFTRDATMIAEALPSVRVCTAVTLLSAMTAIVFNAVTGTGNTRVNLQIELAAVTVYLVYCWVVIEHLRMPLEWAWGSEFTYWITMGGLAFLYLKSGKWRGKVLQ